MSSELSYVQKTLKDIRDGDAYGDELVFDSRSKRIRSASHSDDPDTTMDITPEDTKVWQGKSS